MTKLTKELLDAEIADLKRQLRQALAQVEIVDRALGDPGNTSSKVALDAYVQEKVNRAVLAESKWWHQFIPITHDRNCSYDLLDLSPTADYCDCHFERRRISCNERLAANGAKVVATSADPPKEK